MMMNSTFIFFIVFAIGFCDDSIAAPSDDFSTEGPYQEAFTAPRFPGITMDPRYHDEETSIVGSNSLRTYYIHSEAERERHRIQFRNGLAYDSAGNLLNSGTEHFKVIVDTKGNMYGGPVDVASHIFEYKHTTYLGDQPVADAFTMIVRDGKIETITNYSGHFKPNINLKKYTLTVLKEQGVDISKIKMDEHWWAKNPFAPGAPPIEGPPKNGVEFLKAHPLQLAEGQIPGFTPAVDFWSVAGDWMKLPAKDFPNQAEFKDALLKEKVWPESFLKKLPEVLSSTNLTVNYEIQSAITKRLRAGNLSVADLRQNQVPIPPDILRERNYVIRSIRRKLEAEGVCR